VTAESSDGVNMAMNMSASLTVGFIRSILTLENIGLVDSEYGGNFVELKKT
jgi:hypothetical protein